MVLLEGSADGSEWFLLVIGGTDYDSWAYEVEFLSGGWQPLASGTVAGGGDAANGSYEQGAWTDMRARAQAERAGAIGPWSDWVVWQVQL